MEEEIKEIYEKLTDENKEIINLLARGMQLAQQEKGKE